MPKRRVISRTKKKRKRSKTKRRSSSRGRRRARYGCPPPSSADDSMLMFRPERYDPFADEVRCEKIQVFVMHPTDEQTLKEVEDENLGFPTVDELKTVCTYSLQLQVVCRGGSSRTVPNSGVETLASSILFDQKWFNLAQKIRENGYLYLFRSIVVDISEYSELSSLQELPKAILDTAIQNVLKGNRVAELVYNFTHETYEDIYNANLLMGFKSNKDGRFRSLDRSNQGEEEKKEVRHRYLSLPDNDDNFRSYGSINQFAPCKEPVDAEICNVTFQRKIFDDIVSYTLIPPLLRARPRVNHSPSPYRTPF